MVTYTSGNFKEKRDLITGLKTRTNAGRPNWDKVFKQILDQKKGKVTVFYCGPPQLARIIRMRCDQYGFSFRKENLKNLLALNKQYTKIFNRKETNLSTVY
ncbi:hypothetical protein NQ318_016457 [Aromia moschata]|uniref:Ferric reductase NAD binding domain-containing protein n=1 Tax=Aromia moschata TaxID=1265417 RepID=A0AAV8Z650_9CUCU|nr:hypothetical protein NQ318_016457 [Aromia moschata]